MSIFLDPEVVHPRHPHRIHNIFVNSHFLITVSACGFFCHWMDGREGKSSNFQLIFKQVSVDTHINLGNELDRQPSRQIRRHKVKTRAGTMEERRKKNECECRGPTHLRLTSMRLSTIRKLRPSETQVTVQSVSSSCDTSFVSSQSPWGVHDPIFSTKAKETLRTIASVPSSSATLLSYPLVVVV